MVHIEELGRLQRQGLNLGVLHEEVSPQYKVEGFSVHHIEPMGDLREPIGTSTSQSPQLCTTRPSPIRIAAVVMVFFRLPQGKIFFATIDMVAPVSNTPRYSRPPSRIRT